MTTSPANNGLAHIFAKDVDPEKPEVADSPDAAKAPSWFHQKDAAPASHAMEQRYLTPKPERQPIMETEQPEGYNDFRRKMDDRFAHAQELYDAPSAQIQRPTLPLNDIHGRRRLYQQEQRSFIAEERQRKTSNTPWFKMLGLGVSALLVGGGAGLAVVNIDMIYSFGDHGWLINWKC